MHGNYTKFFQLRVAKVKTETNLKMSGQRFQSSSLLTYIKLLGTHRRSFLRNDNAFNRSAVGDTCVLFSAVVRRSRFTPILKKRPKTEPLLRSRTVDVNTGFDCYRASNTRYCCWWFKFSFVHYSIQ